MLQVIIMHRSIFESLMRTLKGHLLYQAEYLSRLLVKPPPGRSEADVLKLASYLTSLQRFQEVPQPKLVQLAKEVTYAELAVGTVICRQGILSALPRVYAASAGFVAASKAHPTAGTWMSVLCKHCCLQALLWFPSKTQCQRLQSSHAVSVCASALSCKQDICGCVQVCLCSILCKQCRACFLLIFFTHDLRHRVQPDANVPSTNRSHSNDALEMAHACMHIVLPHAQ